MNNNDNLTNLCNSVAETNKNFTELGNMCGRAFLRQCAINKRLQFFACLGIAFGVWQNNKIKKLRAEIEALKASKEE